MMNFLVTPRNMPTRYADRVGYDRPGAYAALDEALLCHLAFVVDGEPRLIPTLHVRVGDALYLHGSTGSGPMLALREPGVRVSVAVTLLDGLVFARSQFDHSANYRSVIVHGQPRLVTDEAEKLTALTALVDKAGAVAAQLGGPAAAGNATAAARGVAPDGSGVTGEHPVPGEQPAPAGRPGEQPAPAGRAGDTRPPTAKELAQTAVFALPLEEVSIKRRAAGVNDDPADVALPHWAGVVPVWLTAGPAEPDAGVAAPVPGYLTPPRSPWLEPTVLAGQHVRLEPLDLCHAGELFQALDDEEVWRYIPGRRPATVAEMADNIRGKLAEARRGLRTAWVQKDAVTGAVVGTTSYCPPDEKNRFVHIGSTQLSRSVWRTGINTEAKLLLMRHAFETLGAVRVELQTDNLNIRSQNAIQRIGGVREGVHRSNKLRRDGTWRDTHMFGMTVEQWPDIENRLVKRLAQG
jgi:uncharacterized protein